MASQIRVTSAQVTTKRETLKKLNAKLKSQIADMDTTERQLLTMWEGDAANAFKKNYENDTKKMDAFYKVVENYCTALQNIVKQYESTEKQNVSIASTRGTK